MKSKRFRELLAAVGIGLAFLSLAAVNYYGNLISPIATPGPWIPYPTGYSASRPMNTNNAAIVLSAYNLTSGLSQGLIWVGVDGQVEADLWCPTPADLETDADFLCKGTFYAMGSGYRLQRNQTDFSNRRNWQWENEVNAVGDLTLLESTANGTTAPSVTRIEIDYQGNTSISGALYATNGASTAAGQAPSAGSLVTSNLALVPTLTANLPAASASYLGYIYYCPDVITSAGIGGPVQCFTNPWAASSYVWKETVDRPGIQATANLTNWVLNAWQAGYTGHNVLGDVTYIGNYGSVSYGLLAGITGTSGTGASATTSGNTGNDSGYGTAVEIGLNTAAGYAYQYFPPLASVPTSASSVNWLAAAVSVNNPPLSGTNAAAVIGWSGSVAHAPNNNAASFACLFYDPQEYFVSSGSLNAGYTATWYNDWLAVVNKGGSTISITDTGLPVSSTTTSPNLVMVACFSGAVLTATNYVWATTNSSNLPSGGLLPTFSTTNNTAPSSGPFSMNVSAVQLGMVHAQRTFP